MGAEPPILNYAPGGGVSIGGGGNGSGGIPGAGNLYYWPSIDNLTGGIQATDLDAQDIADLPSESLIIVITGVDGDETHWRRMPDATDPVTDLDLGIIVPTNYDSVARPWVLLRELEADGGGGLPWKNVMDYGAAADNATDDTAAFNAAIAAAGPTGITYVPPGTYLILGQIELNGGDRVNWPARLVGAGNKVSALHITWPNTQTVGTIQAARGAWVSDLRFFYDQPDPGPPGSTDYSVFHHYQPVIYVNQTFIVLTVFGTPEYGGKGFYRGGRYERLRIENAWDGITCVGGTFDNTLRPWFGQEVFVDLEMGTLNRGISLDMLTDSCYIDRLRVFPYGMSGNQETAQRLPGHAVGIYAGKLDDTRVCNSFFLVPALDAHPGLSGDGVHLNFVNCSFDSFAHVELTGGTSSIHGYCIFTDCRFGNAPASSAQDIEVRITNIDVQFVGCYFAHANVTGLNCIEASDTSGKRIVAFNNCQFIFDSHDVVAVLSSANLIVTGCHFDRTPTVAFTNPAIRVSAGQATITDNQSEPMTSGSGVFLDLDIDDYHMVTGNTGAGWSMSWPATQVKIQAFGNTLSTTSVGASGQNLSLGVKQLFVEGGTTGKLKLTSGSGSPESVVTADPGSLYLNTSGGIYYKQTGTSNTGWLAPGGSGTVTTFSAGDLSPLFTTTEINPTTAPALSFALTNAAANSWFGNATGSSAAPAYNTSVFPAALMPALTGPVTTTAGGVATTITNSAVTYAKIQNVSANSRLLGSGSAGTGLPPAEITVGSGLTMTGTTLTAAAGGGTVTNTGGNLTANSVVLGAGTVDTKVVPGVITDGASKLTLGVSTTSVGSIALNNLTSGSVTIQPATGALSTATMTIPAGATNPVVADTGAANNFLTGISTAGAITKAQPAFTNLTGNWTLAQGPSTTAAALLGRTSASAGIPQEITLGTNLSMSGQTLNAGGGAAGGSITFKGNIDYTILNTDKIVATNAAFTTLHTWTMPLANTVTAGNSISIMDLQATLTAANRLLIVRSGSDTFVPGAWTQINLDHNGQGVQFTSDGVSKWYVTYFSPSLGSANGQVMLFDNGAHAWNIAPVGLTFAIVAAGAGKIAQSDGTNFIASLPAWPTTAGTARKVVISDGTNLVSSTETWAVPGASTNNVLKSDGTNWTAAQLGFSNLSGNYTLAQGPSITAGKLLGRDVGSAGIPQEITLGTNLSMTGTTLNATGGAGGTPGGSTTQVQFNDASAFGGDAGLVYDKTTDALTLVGPLNIGGTINAAGAGTNIDLTLQPKGTGWTFVNPVFAGVSIPASGWGLGIGTHYSGSAGEINFINRYAVGTSPLFTFHTYTGGTMAQIGPIGVVLPSNEMFQFSSGAGSTSIPVADTAFARNAAGVIEVNNGTAGTYRDMKLRNLILSGGTQIPAASPTVLFLKDDGTYATPAGGAAGAGGSTTQVQYNNAGALAGITGATTNGTTLSLLNLTMVPVSGTNNSTINFGANYTNAALILYDGGPTGSFGWGMQSKEMQFFMDVWAADVHWSWNKGGALQTARNNEVMNLDGTTGSLNHPNTAIIGFSSTGVSNGALDTGLCRNAAGAVEINSGTAGTYRDLKARTVNVTSDYQVNGTSTAADYVNASTGTASMSTSDAYLIGSQILLPAGAWKAKGQYRCVFDCVKSAGTGAIVVTLRVGTAASTADPAKITWTFGAGTGVADTGNFEVFATWRTVGSGTSAVITGFIRCQHNLPTTGLISNAAVWTIMGPTSSGFDSTAATTLGLSFNGSTAFAGSIVCIQAQYVQ